MNQGQVLDALIFNLLQDLQAVVVFTFAGAAVSIWRRCASPCAECPLVAVKRV